jgi:hypothetical protein
MTVSAQEPPTKKLKVQDWAGHTLNIAHAVVYKEEGRNLAAIAGGQLQVLEGIGPKSEVVLEALGLETVKDLATYKFFLIARAIKTLAATEKERPTDSVMNIDNALVKDYETKSLTELLDAPLSAMEGLTEKADVFLETLGVKSIGDMASFKYAHWAEAICQLAPYEELNTKEERKIEKELKKLA